MGLKTELVYSVYDICRQLVKGEVNLYTSSTRCLQMSSQVISYRLSPEEVLALRQKALPGESDNQTAQRLMRESLGVSTASTGLNSMSTELSSMSTASLDEKIESIVEERFSALVGSQNDLLSRLQSRLQEVELQLGKSQAWLNQRSAR